MPKFFRKFIFRDLQTENVRQKLFSTTLKAWTLQISKTSQNSTKKREKIFFFCLISEIRLNVFLSFAFNKQNKNFSFPIHDLSLKSLCKKKKFHQ